MKFAIGKQVGVRENMPNVTMDKAFSPESENIILRYDEARRIRGRSGEFLDDDGDKVQSPDENPFIHFAHFESNAGGAFTERIFGFTKEHIYLWNTATKAWDEKFESSSECTEWFSEVFNNKLIVTNGVDKVQYWSGATPGNSFTPLGSASGINIGDTTYLTTAKYIISFEGYLILGYVTVGGTLYPQTIYWCSFGDETDWDTTGSGDANSLVFRVGADFLKGFGRYKSQLIVFKEQRYFPMWLVESSEVFNTAETGTTIGLLATHSVINDKYGRLYWIANDYTVREISTPEPISGFIDKTVRGISPTYEDHIAAAYISEYGEIWWAIPSAGSETGNDTIIAFNPDEGTWEIHDFAIRAFSRWSQQTVYTIDTIPFPTINSIGWKTIDTVENVEGFPLDVGSDYSGYAYNLHNAETDNGEDYTGKLVLSTDFSEKKSLGEFKRSSGGEFYFYGEGTEDLSINVYAKEDNAVSWSSLGSISLNGSAEIISPYLAWDLRFKHLLLKLEAANRFRFIGTIFDFEWDGDR